MIIMVVTNIIIIIELNVCAVRNKVSFIAKSNTVKKEVHSDVTYRQYYNIITYVTFRYHYSSKASSRATINSVQILEFSNL